MGFGSPNRLSHRIAAGHTEQRRNFGVTQSGVIPAQRNRLPTKIKFASEETPTALRAAFAELVIALGPDRQNPEFLAEVLWSALHGMVVLVQSERIPATGAEVRLNVLVQKFSR